MRRPEEVLLQIHGEDWFATTTNQAFVKLNEKLDNLIT
jgi:hypothetical protein